MVLSTLFSCIAASFLLLNAAIVNAVPMNEAQPLTKRGSKLHGKFLHITDIHIDPLYLEGADPDSYCHKHGKKRSSESGKFGALGTDCDTPQALVDATFKFLKKSVKDIDFIIYTGDTARHDRDDNNELTQKEIIKSHTTVMKYFQKAYDTKHVPYIPTIGNNDGFNHNDVKKNDKIFKKLESIWEPLNLNLTSTFTKGGYYIQEVIKGKLSIVNLNTMYFFEKNDEVDDCDSSSSAAAIQMKWLTKILQLYSKKKGHQLYLMGHVPPIDDDGSKLYKDQCYKQYMKLLGQYGSTISDDTLNAVVSDGGDHKYTVMSADDDDAEDEKKKLQKTSVGLFNAPSVVPKNNPALRVYTYDTGKSDNFPVGTIRDWHQYYVDLEKANDNRNAKFQLEYQASKLYGVDHFDGPGVGKAILKIANDKKARKQYKKYAKVSSK
ncbi:hypothetical protein [Parasitella parasitica]|uniref:Uncharacterized protein n=1 Tax=Parasitella parasitica TaxID=35722 RepID=A0A0B7NRR7_9FUNG|nr:hypothetical protein [Parasitella parasitica]